MEQVVPPVQLLPHIPQLPLLVWRSTQLPLQLVSPPEQVVPQTPALHP
jgi:hypothetical protein